MEPGRLLRALEQPITILNKVHKRNRRGVGIKYSFDVQGSTGNCYNVTLDSMFDCTCLDQQMRGGRCKHILYILIFQFKVAFGSELLSKIEYTEADKKILHKYFSGMVVSPKKIERKSIEDCSICMELITKKQKSDWCKMSCGQNFHSKCIKRWLSIQKTQSSDLTCPMCRSNWMSAPP